MAGIIPLSVPNFKGNELKYVTEAVTTEWVSTGGSFVGEFEHAVAEAVGAPGAVACQSGTAGLHIALMLLGVEPGDAVIVPSLTFIAAVNPVKYIGAEPIFMDCDDYLCMDPEKLERFCREECTLVDGVLTDNATGRRIKAVTVVHVFGNMADMEPIMDVAARYNLKVLEDSTEAIRTRYTAGRYAGKCAGTMGDIGVYSFNGNKIITTGGGGMIVSNDEAILAHARHLTTQAKVDTVNFIHDEVGYNYRLTNLQAALGVAQMEELEDFIGIKKRNYDLYVRGVEGIDGLRMLPFRAGVESNHWFYSLYVEDSFPIGRDELIKRFAERGIQTRPVWGLISEQKPYLGSREYMLEKAPMYRGHIVNLPCSTSLDAEAVEAVLGVLYECAGESR